MPVETKHDRARSVADGLRHFAAAETSINPWHMLDAAEVIDGLLAETHEAIYAEARCPTCWLGQMVDVTNENYRKLGVLCGGCGRIADWSRLSLETTSAEKQS